MALYERPRDEDNPFLQRLAQRAADPFADMLVDWSLFWSTDQADTEWLVDQVLPAGRSVALFAPGGTGKSLLALWLAAALATGREVFGATRDPVDVLYLDYEMTESDLQERLVDMGYGPDDDLSHLHYALLPALSPLDTEAGGTEVAALAAKVEARLVVVDTFGRAVHGDENEAETIRRWERHTGRHLKRAGIAFVRVDHAGKNVDLGQRGSSAKNDDVDIVWLLERRDPHGDANAYRLVAKKRRMRGVPETIDLMMRDDDVITFTSTTLAMSWPMGTARLADLLDELGVPADYGRPSASKMLRKAGHKATNATLSAALKWRRNRLGQPGKAVRNGVRNDLDVTGPNLPQDSLGQITKPQVDGIGQFDRTASDTGSRPDERGGWCPLRHTPRSGPAAASAIDSWDAPI